MEKQLESNSEKRSTIIITIGTNEKVAKLCLKKLRFGGVFKVLKKY